VQTDDGCSVELYRRLPYFGELDSIRSVFPYGSSVLELGAGCGRLTRVLLGWGVRPTAVDFSHDMLAHIPDGVERVCSSIQDLRLERTFDVVLLASCLINHPDEDVRGEFLHCAARHLHPGGRFILERHDPDWLESAPLGEVAGARLVRVFVDAVDRSQGVIAMSIRYDLEGQSWSQEFSASALNELEIERELANAGFVGISWHGAARRWAVALRGGNDAT
jgi:SAM-dependent methyltransferase